jgi:hypothetical protein
VLVTSEEDLATDDAVAADVWLGLAGLLQGAQALLDDLAPPAAAPALPAGAAGLLPLVAAAPLVQAGATALASFLPGALSLLSADRKVNSAATADVDNVAATAAVEGGLRRQANPPHVIDATFRLLQRSQVFSRVFELYHLRSDLIQARLALGTPAEDTDDAAKVAVVDAAVKRIDDFMTAIRTSPANGGKAPLVSAALIDLLHNDDSEIAISHVVMVKAHAGETSQFTSNRPLFAKDRVSTVAHVNVSFKLLEVATDGIVAAGSVTGTAEGSGTIGSHLDFKVVGPTQNAAPAADGSLILWPKI